MRNCMIWKQIEVRQLLCEQSKGEHGGPQTVGMRSRITGIKCPCQSSMEMLRQSKKPLCFNPLPLIVMFVWINESGFVSKILYVVTAFSDTRKSIGKRQS